ncbi:MAG: tRNA (cytidine(34)-2'-O)-methyltransferase [Clostridiales bacterium]|nr:tRNA (cytidine(34)-2'-O)-methyltransferase [Clostridiales bacterium]
MKRSLNVVLYEPEIPQNTGNIMRTCVAFGCALHLIKPLGFDIENPKFRRSTTNHITWADYTLYDSYEDFRSRNEGEYFFMTRYGKKPPSSIDFALASHPAGSDTGSDGQPPVPLYLIFGRESTGIPYDILKDNLERCFRIPMAPECRSLNLSNAAAIAIYECVSQLGYPDLSLTEVQKGEDFLESYDATLGR